MSKGYQVYKPKLRIEFSHRCAYCETREPEIGGSKSFHIDHYKPKKIFPALICAYDNLIYSCRDCNSYKGAYWPSYLERLSKKIILNPRSKEPIEKHIDTSGFAWSGRTPEGKWTVKKLRLDSTVLSLRREDRSRIEKKIQQINTMIEDVKQRLRIDKLSSVEQKKLKDFIEDETKIVESFERKIFGAMD